MRTRTALLVATSVTALLLGMGCRLGPWTEWERTAPWSGVRFAGDDVDVLLEGEWYRLIRLHGHETRDVIEVAKEEFGSRWQERIVEDIYEVLDEMGAPPGDTVELELGTEHGVVWRTEPMSEERRDAAKRRLERERRRQALTQTISREAALRDVAELERLIQERFAYRDLAGVSADGLFAELRQDLPAGDIKVRDLAYRLQCAMTRFGDGHSGIQVGLDDLLPEGYLPFLVEPTGGGLVAFHADRSGLVDPERPYLISLDGRPVAEWRAAAREFVTAGSPSLVELDTARALRWVSGIRAIMRQPNTDTIAVGLAASPQGTAQVTTLRLADERPLYRSWPRSKSRLLAGNVGYLRLPTMGLGADRETLNRTMESFTDARGLVIDVRSNGGGTRHALLALAPWFLDERDAHVGSVAAYRLASGDSRVVRGGYLRDRFMLPADEASYSQGAQNAIARASATFQPQWSPAEDEFSVWHWLVLERAANPDAGRFAGPVVVLIDRGCFSATDIFVGALAGLPQVTLVGTATAGGSGRSRRHSLPESGLSVRLSSMASFRPDGRPYDGLGIEPDVLVEPNPEDYFSDSDAQLDRAVEVIEAALQRGAQR